MDLPDYVVTLQKTSPFTTTLHKVFEGNVFREVRDTFKVVFPDNSRADITLTRPHLPDMPLDTPDSSQKKLREALKAFNEEMLVQKLYIVGIGAPRHGSMEYLTVAESELYNMHWVLVTKTKQLHFRNLAHLFKQWAAKNHPKFHVDPDWNLTFLSL